MKRTYFLLFSVLGFPTYMLSVGDCFGECAREVKELIVGDNFREVSSGKFYRSKQMAPSHLYKRLKDHKINVIINLCSEEENKLGEEEGKKGWHKWEEFVAALNKAQVVDVPLHRKDMPKKESLLRLIEVFKEHKDDVILIHCLWGIDRTGLVAFLWKFLVDGKSKEEAAEELTGWVWVPWWNHWEWNRPNMDKFVKMCPEDASDFPRWLEEEYSF